MYTNTRFGDLMKAFPRTMFKNLVNKHAADKHSKGFKRWDQLIAMMYGQLSGCRSLRELEVAFNSHSAHHYHLGTRSLKRSTLADTNAKGDNGLYAALCEGLMTCIHRKIRHEIKDMLYLLDSTPIALKGYGYDNWARSTPRTQGLKVHMLYAPQAQAPVYSQITAPTVNDIEDAKTMELVAGATYVFDKGYYDYNWWHSFDHSGAHFVTRFKRNAGIRVVKAWAAPSADSPVLADEQVALSNPWPGGKRRNPCHMPLRCVTVAREGGSPLVLATNDFTRSAEQIADLYKTRWQIELFFKWLKQNLKIKRFLGRSETAVKTQIYIALVTYLLLWLHHNQQDVTTSLKQFTVLLSAGLFQRPQTDYQVWRRRVREREAFLKRQRQLL